MKKRHVQGALCLIAITHLYLYGPGKVEGSIGDCAGAIYHMAWEAKRLLQIPIICGFLILTVQFLWPSGRKQSVPGSAQCQRPGESAN